MTNRRDWLPDARDGLSRVQRVVMHELDRVRRETGRTRVPTLMLYGRVAERLNISESELQDVLASLGVGPRV